MRKIKIKILEGSRCDPCDAAAPMPQPPRASMYASDCGGSSTYKNVHNGEEARMHRTTLAHLMADVKVLLDLVKDEDDLPEWLETKIPKAGDYMSSAARYIAGNTAREQGPLEEEKNCGCNQTPCKTFGRKNLKEASEDEISRLVSAYQNVNLQAASPQQINSVIDALAALPQKPSQPS